MLWHMAYNPKGKGGFNRGGGGGFSARKPWEKGGRSNDRGAGRAYGAEREMFQATCAACHEACEVPFRPSGGKPVYCKNCFDRSGRDEGRNEGRNFTRPDRGPRESHAHHDDIRQQLEQLNKKMDRLIELMTEKGATEPVEALGYIAAKKAKKKVAKKKTA